jgi:hypothetical protein
MGVRQGGLRDQVENGMRVLGGRGAHLFHPVSLHLWTRRQAQKLVSRVPSLVWEEE